VLYNPSVFDNSKGGPVQVSWGNWVGDFGPTITWLALALQAVGIPLSRVGFNSGSLSGYGAWVTSTISPNDAERSTSHTSYLEQGIQATEIMVYAHTQAPKSSLMHQKRRPPSLSLLRALSTLCQPTKRSYYLRECSIHLNC
jgi:choline dehydrogenase